MTDIDKINALTDLSEDEKQYLISRTCSTFRHQFLFYYELNGNKGGLFEGRPIVRAIEETINCFFEEDMYMRMFINQIIDSEVGHEKKLKDIHDLINNSPNVNEAHKKIVPVYLNDKCLLD